MNISKDDMMHIIFELYGVETESSSGILKYTLDISGFTFTTSKSGDKWEDKYYTK
jgi:hypothetical protein